MSLGCTLILESLPSGAIPDRKKIPSRDGNFGDPTFVGRVECAEKTILAGRLIPPGSKAKKFESFISLQCARGGAGRRCCGVASGGHGGWAYQKARPGDARADHRKRSKKITENTRNLQKIKQNTNHCDVITVYCNACTFPELTRRHPEVTRERS